MQSLYLLQESELELKEAYHDLLEKKIHDICIFGI